MGKGQGAMGKGQGAMGKGQGAMGKGQWARGKGQGVRKMLGLLLPWCTSQREAKLNSIKAIATFSEALFTSHKNVETLIGVIKASQKLK